MIYRKLGKTGLNVSIVSFGGIPIQRISAEEAEKVIHSALDSGINFFDTARAYSNSESKLGKALEKRRREIYIATKSMISTKEDAYREIEISLKELNTDYIDLYQVHNIQNRERLDTVLGKDGALEGLKELKSKGVIKYIGITGHIPDLLIKAINTEEFDTVQFPFNPIEYKSMLDLLKRSQELGVGTIAMKPLAGGALKEVANLSIRFIINEGVDVVIPGMDSISQVKENTSSFKPLDNKEKDILNTEVKKWEKAFCRQCGYCMPCPNNINIPLTLLFSAYIDRYGLIEWMKTRIPSLLKTLPTECVECGNCEERCPYRLPIRSMMKDAVKRFRDIGVI